MEYAVEKKVKVQAAREVWGMLHDPTPCHPENFYFKGHGNALSLKVLLGIV